MKEFEDNACIVLDANERFIPFATAELMKNHSLPKECEIEVGMVLTDILARYYIIAKRV